MPASTARRRLTGVLASLLLVGTVLPQPLRAAEVLELQLDGLAIPIDLRQLQEWSKNPETSTGELASWLNLLDGRSRRNLVQLLRAPLLRDRSFGQQLLGSWTGEQLLNEVGELLRNGEAQGSSSNSAIQLRQTVNRLLAQQGELSTLDLLLALPNPRINLQLDGVIELADQWRQQLQQQQRAWRNLGQMGLPRRQAIALRLSERGSGHPVMVPLAVGHRREQLNLELWPPQGRPQQSWVVLMPGLGGGGDQLSWLAAALANWGWPVVVLEHPGSDDTAMKASLEGRRAPPGAESLAERLADVQAVLSAQRQGQLPALGVPAGTPVVLMGHSLGGLTALMSAGLSPERGLVQRCRQALKRLPLTNLSRLLQCQLGSQAPTLRRHDPGTPIAAVVAFNGFGSLLWPHNGLAALKPPVLMVGGSLDLITPPLKEQLEVFATQRNPRSRLVLIDGASHFSPVRVASEGGALFQLGDDLVGVDPLKVQALLLQLSTEFLQSLSQPLLLSPQTRTYNGVQAHVLDSRLARRWQRQIRTPALDPTGPPARQP